jgi:hypothetical protein
LAIAVKVVKPSQYPGDDLFAAGKSLIRLAGVNLPAAGHSLIRLAGNQPLLHPEKNQKIICHLKRIDLILTN